MKTVGITIHLIILIYLARFTLSKEVQYIIELFTNGPSTPKNNYFNNKEFTEYGLNRLLSNGMRQQYVLGKSVRKKYKSVIPEHSDKISTQFFSFTEEKFQESA